MRGNMQLKLDDAGHVVLKDGHPVYTMEDGSDVAHDAPAMIASLNSRRAAAKTFEKRATDAEVKLKAFDDLDPIAAREALEKVSKLNAKQLVDSGQVDAAILARTKPLEEKLTAAEQRAQKAEASFFSEKVGGSFARSKYIAEKLALPAETVQKIFGDQFRVEDGVIKAKDFDGNEIFSPTKNGEPADFEQSIAFLVAQYPHKDSLLKADNRTGSGAPAGQAAGAAGKKTISREAFDQLNPSQRMEHMTKGGAVTD